MSKDYSLLLFDLDGTIIDTDYLIVHTFQTLYNLYRDGNMTPIEDLYYFSGPPIVDTLKKEFPNMDPNFMMNEFYRISRSYYPLDMKLYPLVKETIIALKQAGYKLGIVTNKIHSTSEYCLSLIGLNDIFDVVVAFDDVKKGKPDPEGIIKAMDTFHEKYKDKVLYIGDNESDLDTANNAGIDCLLIYGGPRFKPLNLPSKYKVDSFKEIGDILL